jgi:hypothetical protein
MPSGQWDDDDDYDVLADGAVVGRIFNAAASPIGSPWMGKLAFGQHEDRTPTHGHAATREAAMGGVREKLATRVRGCEHETRDVGRALCSDHWHERVSAQS